MTSRNLEPHRLLHQLWQAPFSSPNDLSGWGHLTLSQCQKGLRELRRDGLAMQFTLGMGERAKARWCLTEEGIMHCQSMLHDDPSWTVTENGLRNLSGRLPMVERVYDLLPEAMDVAGDQPCGKDGGAEKQQHRVTRVRWLVGTGVQAVAEYDGLWTVAFLWAGRWNSAGDLAGKLGNRFDGLEPVAPAGWWEDDGEPEAFPWEPSLWCVIAEDAWAADIACRELSDIGTDPARIRVVAPSVETHLPASIPRAVGDVEEREGIAKLGRPARIRSWLENPQYQAMNVSLPYRILGTIESWPACRLSHISRLCRETNSKVKPALEEVLMETGLVVEFDGHHYLTDAGLLWASRRDRVHISTVRARFATFCTEDSHNRKRLVRHDSGLANLASRLSHQRVPVVPGWRAITDFPGLTQLAPDAVVRMHSADHGDEWYHLEYERAAQSRRAVERKLSPYLTLAESHSTERTPLLVVCQRPESEALFWSVGNHLPLYTTHYREATRGALVGEETVWRRNGHPASLRLPQNSTPHRTADTGTSSENGEHGEVGNGAVRINPLQRTSLT